MLFHTCSFLRVNNTCHSFRSVSFQYSIYLQALNVLLCPPPPLPDLSADAPRVPCLWSLRGTWFSLYIPASPPFHRLHSTKEGFLCNQGMRVHVPFHPHRNSLSSQPQWLHRPNRFGFHIWHISLWSSKVKISFTEKVLPRQEKWLLLLIKRQRILENPLRRSVFPMNLDRDP